MKTVYIEIKFRAFLFTFGYERLKIILSPFDIRKIGRSDLPESDPLFNRWGIRGWAV